MEDSLDNGEGPITFEDLGLQRSDQTKQTLLGKVRTIGSLSKWEWMFLIISLAALFASIGLTIQRLATLDKHSDDFTFAILLMVTNVFCLYYIIRGVLQESLYEIIVFLTTIVILIIYCITNYAVPEKRTDIKLGRLIGVLVIGPVLIGLGLWICKGYRESGNLVYRAVGANSEMQAMCRTQLLALSLAVFDLQLQASILVLVLKNGTKLSEDEKIVLGVGAALAVVYFLTAFLSMKYEVKVGAIILWILSIFEPGYIIYKIYAVHKSNAYSYLLRDSFYGASVMVLIVRFSFILVTALVFKNFGKGLKERVYGIEEERKRASSNDSAISATVEKSSSQGTSSPA